MNKIVASVGLVALGASGLQAALIPGLDDSTKPWSVSATLRGFYDSNRGTAPKGSEEGSFGIEISPSIGVKLPWEATTFDANYIYSYKWYDKALPGAAGHDDQTHLFNLYLDHSFSERYKLNVRDSFALGQEPDVLRSGNAFTTFERISGNNIRNDGSFDFRGQITPLIGGEIGYGNAYFNYAEDGADLGAPGGDPENPSFSGLLDRVENRIHLDSRWVVLPETVAIGGYQYRQVNYTGDEIIGLTAAPGGGTRDVFSDNRDFRSHYFYVGADQVFNPRLTAALRIGARYVDFYNDPSDSGDGWGPYVMGNVRWNYAVDSFAQVGLSHDINSTDQVGASTNFSTFTASAESTTLYGSVNHQITPKLWASFIGQFQNSSFEGGTLDGESEQYYLIGLNLSYRFTRCFSAEVGYNYDNLDSQVPGRSFDRNRVYIGITGSY